jgi:AraC-like DNA-binding protein
MPSSAVCTFTDPDEYAAAIRAGSVDLTITGRGDFKAKLTRIDLHRLWMQRFSDNLPRICDVTNLIEDRVFATFRTKPGPSLLQGGIEIRRSAVLRFDRVQECYHRSSGSAEFGTMSLPTQDLASIGEVMSGVDLTTPCDAMSIPSAPAIMGRLQRLHAAAGDLADNAPEIIANPDAARGLEQALIEALVDCLGYREHHHSSVAQGQHAIVMRRFRNVVEENPEQPLYIPEICKAIRVPSRTLSMVCQEHLGMGPKRYLVLRRMHLARRALRDAASEATTVTDIATRFGFWQLGRFSVEYQALFGEAPSATLRQPSG